MTETFGTIGQEVKLFYCYAHQDEVLRDELHINLAGLRRQYQLTDWYDQKILPGEKWEEAIVRQLSIADVILLLISPHFVDSDFCYNREMQHALKRHHEGSCCVIPILLRPTCWEETPLSGIQMLPTNAKPITSWLDRYEAFHNVASGISTAIKALLASRTQKTKEQWLTNSEPLYASRSKVDAVHLYIKSPPLPHRIVRPTARQVEQWNCGHSNRLGARYCHACGRAASSHKSLIRYVQIVKEPLSSTNMTQWTCGHKNRKNAYYCRICGIKRPLS